VRADGEGVTSLGKGRGKRCATCGRFRNRQGVGSMHCHSCSGIDSMCLQDSAFWPLIMRRRLRQQHVITPRDDAEEEALSKEDDKSDVKSQTSSAQFDDFDDNEPPPPAVPRRSTRGVSRVFGSSMAEKLRTKRQSMPDLMMFRGARRSSMPTLSMEATQFFAK